MDNMTIKKWLRVIAESKEIKEDVSIFSDWLEDRGDCRAVQLRSLLKAPVAATAQVVRMIFDEERERVSLQRMFEQWRWLDSYRKQQEIRKVCWGEQRYVVRGHDGQLWSLKAADSERRYFL